MDTITTAEAAALLGIKPRTVLWDLAHHDDFPRPVRTGRYYRWHREPLLAWREQHPSKPRRPVKE